MRYISTRGGAPELDFRGVTLTGLARDGGLYVPDRWPTLAAETLRSLRGASYAETAVTVLAPFVGDVLSRAELAALVEEAYASFAHAAVTPLVQLDRRQWLLELFHGPTLAFKDVALQLLGLLFERFLADDAGPPLTIVGATSGDTGSAAIAAVAGRERTRIVMLHPAGRVTEVQRRQMTTVLAPNVHNLAIEGSFDDAQAMVKRLFVEPTVTAQLRLSAVNSINWARLAAQVVYYVYAAVRLGAPERRVAFAVPTGNFGDVFAGYVASRMGLPVERLVVATNVNDILHRALCAGDYSAADVVATATPSMDIQVSSNFERLLFDAGARDPGKLAAQMTAFDRDRRLLLSPEQRSAIASLFCSARVDPAEMAETMRWAREACGELIDPHTAIGLAAARRDDGNPAVPMVTLATAHPAKFSDTVERATGARPSLPPRVGALFDREERLTTLPNDYAAVRDFVLAVGG